MAKKRTSTSTITTTGSVGTKQIGSLMGETRSGKMLLMHPFGSVWRDIGGARFRTSNFAGYRLDRMLMDFVSQYPKLVESKAYMDQGGMPGDMIVEVRLLKGRETVKKAFVDFIINVDLNKYSARQIAA